MAAPSTARYHVVKPLTVSGGESVTRPGRLSTWTRQVAAAEAEGAIQRRGGLGHRDLGPVRAHLPALPCSAIATSWR